jgi:hypothetical protein
MRVILPIFFFCVFVPFFWQGTNNNKPYYSSSINDTSWSVQLNELNYLVLKASSINLINGLHLSKKQASELKTLAEQIEVVLPPAPDIKNHCSNEIVEIRNVYINLVSLLIKRDTIPASFKEKVFEIRENESVIIKKTLLGAQKEGYHSEGCLKCHCTPSGFPSGNINQLETKPINDKVRKETDLAHVKGLFGEEGTLLLWEYKSTVDSILSNGQKYVLKDFRCCLLPSDLLKNPARIGQAAFSSEWIDYLTDIRTLSDDSWNSYKPLYLEPIKDVIKATLPGIRKNEIEKRLADVEAIIVEARQMNRMDFEIQKDQLSERLSKAISIDELNGEATRLPEDRQFIAAMFLLYFGSPQLYDKIIMETE